MGQSSLTLIEAHHPLTLQQENVGKEKATTCCSLHTCRRAESESKTIDINCSPCPAPAWIELLHAVFLHLWNPSPGSFCAQRCCSFLAISFTLALQKYIRMQLCPLGVLACPCISNSLGSTESYCTKVVSNSSTYVYHVFRQGTENDEEEGSSGKCCVQDWQHRLASTFVAFPQCKTSRKSQTLRYGTCSQNITKCSRHLKTEALNSMVSK